MSQLNIEDIAAATEVISSAIFSRINVILDVEKSIHKNKSSAPSSVSPSQILTFQKNLISFLSQDTPQAHLNLKSAQKTADLVCLHLDLYLQAQSPRAAHIYMRPYQGDRNPKFFCSFSLLGQKQDESKDGDNQSFSVESFLTTAKKLFEKEAQSFAISVNKLETMVMNSSAKPNPTNNPFIPKNVKPPK